MKKKDLLQTLLCLALAPIILFAGWFGIRNLDRILPDGTGDMILYDSQFYDTGESGSQNRVQTLPPFTENGFPEGTEFLSSGSDRFEEALTVLKCWASSSQGSFLLNRIVLSSGIVPDTAGKGVLGLWNDGSTWLLAELNGSGFNGEYRLHVALNENNGLCLLQYLPVQSSSAALTLTEEEAVLDEARAIGAAFLKAFSAGADENAAVLTETSDPEALTAAEIGHVNLIDGRSFRLDTSETALSDVPYSASLDGTTCRLTYTASSGCLVLLYECITMQITGYAWLP